MKTSLLSLGMAIVVSAVFADTGVPVVSDVTFTQNKMGSRVVTITYTLKEAPGIITVDVLTNNVSIGAKNITALSGAVNRLVTGLNQQHTITWHPDKSWLGGHKVSDAVIRVNAWATNAPPLYMAVDLRFDGQENMVRYYVSEDTVPGGITNDIYKTDVILMRRIDAKDVNDWQMGSQPGELGRADAVETNQPVTLPNDYYIGVYELTQRQWAHVITSRPWPSYFYIDREMRPLENVSFNEFRTAAPTSSTPVYGGEEYFYPNDPCPDSFLGKLRAKCSIPFDLPSEAQWEFACRAGKYGSVWNDGSAITETWKMDHNLVPLARFTYTGGRYQDEAGTWTNFDSSAGPTGATAIVGSYLPNAWGLYDMHGNIQEFCLDFYEAMHIYPDGDGAVYLTSGVTNAVVIKSGNFEANPSGCRSASRGSYRPYNRNRQYGFRLAVTL